MGISKNNKSGHKSVPKWVERSQMLSEKEWVEFGFWLESSLLNKSPSLFLLYNEVKIYWPSFKPLNGIQKQLFRNLFPSGKNAKQQLENKLSKLSAAIFEFLAFKNFVNNEEIKSEMLRKELFKRKLYIESSKITKRVFERIEVKRVKGASDFLEYAILASEIYYHPRRQEIYTDNPLSLSDYENNLDAFYKLAKYRIIHEKVARSSINRINFSAENELKCLDVLVSDFEPSAISYYKSRISTGRAKSVEECKTRIKEYLNIFDLLPLLEKKIFLFSLINDCARLINQENNIARKEIFVLYNFGLNKNLLVENGHVTKVTFNNYLLICDELGLADDGQEFINNYYSKLFLDIRADGKRWSEALIHFMKNEFIEVENVLFRNVFNDQLFELQARILVLRTRMEMFLLKSRKPSSIIKYTQTFQSYLKKNNKYVGSKKQQYLDFVIYCRKLVLANLTDNSIRKTRLLENKMIDHYPLVSKNWLIGLTKRMIRQLVGS